MKIWAPPARDVKSNAAVGIALTVALAMALTVGAVVLFVKYDLGAYFLRRGHNGAVHGSGREYGQARAPLHADLLPGR